MDIVSEKGRLPWSANKKGCIADYLSSVCCSDGLITLYTK